MNTVRVVRIEMDPVEGEFNNWLFLFEYDRENLIDCIVGFYVDIESHPGDLRYVTESQDGALHSRIKSRSPLRIPKKVVDGIINLIKRDKAREDFKNGLAFLMTNIDFEFKIPRR